MSDASNNCPKLTWGIVGGGMMGLTLALRLARLGQKVTILEAAPEIGGLASKWQIADFTWDKHYHVTLLSDKYLRNLLSELDLEEQVRWVETKTGFLTDGRLHSMSNSWEFLRFPPLNLWEKFRLAGTILLASRIRDERPLERIPVADWLRKWSGSGAFHKLWLPLLKAKLGNAYQRVSAAFIWTTINRMYRARKSGLKKEMFGYVPGGYASVLGRLRTELDSLRVDVLTSCPVQQVAKAETGGLTISTCNSESLKFDRVVLTTPSFTVSRLCEDLCEEEVEQHQSIEYLGILCASLVLKQGLDKYYVTNITEPNVPFTAVIEMTALVTPQELGGNHLVYLPRYVTSDDESWQWSDEEIQERFLQAIESLYPNFRRDDVVAFRVSRVKEVMALPTLNYSEKVPTTPTSVENLFVVNSAQIIKGTLNVNEVIEVAESALQEHLIPSIEDHRPEKLPSPVITGTHNDQANCELVARS